MVPLVVEDNYRADGWLGMLLGTRMYYAFCGSVLTSEAAFEGKLNELCRELGDRGQPVHRPPSSLVLPEGLPPAPAPAPAPAPVATTVPSPCSATPRVQHEAANHSAEGDGDGGGGGGGGRSTPPPEIYHVR